MTILPKYGRFLLKHSVCAVHIVHCIYFIIMNSINKDIFSRWNATKKVYSPGYSMQQSHKAQKNCKGWVNGGMSLTHLL